MRVRILNGPFKNFSGIIQAVDESKQQAIVIVNFFSRDRSMAYPFSEIRIEDMGR